RERVVQLRRAELRRGPPGPRHAGYLLSRPGRLTPRAAHPHEPRADPLAPHSRAPRLRDRAGQGLPHRRARRDPHSRVPPGRGHCHRQGAHHGAPARHARALRAAHVRRRGEDSPAPQLLPVHRTERRDGRLAAERQGRRALGGVGRMRHGQPQRASSGRHRPGRVPGLRLWHGYRAHPAVPQRPERYERHGRGRYPLQPAVRNGGLMRVPLSWLREFVDVPADSTPEDVHAALVRVGLEEEDIHRFELSGPIVVGQVLEFTPEPQSNGKTINWCSVRVAPEGQTAADGGADVRGIVCGAHNFVEGDKVVVTLPGSVLPGPFPIAARKTYGHVSDGMIASARELGLGEEHDGILRLASLGLDAEVGTDAIALLGLDDTAVEVNVTPDRGYAFSIRGIAREYSHSTGAAFRDPALRADLPFPEDSGDRVASDEGARVSTFPVAIDDVSPIRGRVGATVFVTRVVRNIDPTRPTPPWMVSRLKLVGIRSISLVVDITNYVMFELGQPIHGYDLDRLHGGIVVRRALPGEKIVTLDEQVRALDTEDLLI